MGQHGWKPGFLAYSLRLNRSKSVTLCVLDQVPANEGTVGGGEERTICWSCHFEIWNLKKYSHPTHSPPPEILLRKVDIGYESTFFSHRAWKDIYPGGGAEGGLGTTAEGKTWSRGSMIILPKVCCRIIFLVFPVFLISALNHKWNDIESKREYHITLCSLHNCLCIISFSLWPFIPLKEEERRLKKEEEMKEKQRKRRNLWKNPKILGYKVTWIHSCFIEITDCLLMLNHFISINGELHICANYMPISIDESWIYWY